MPSEHKTFIPLAGSRHQPLAQSRPAGPLDSSEVISITVRTRPASSDNDLERKVAEIYSQPIASREYVAPEEIATEHGADPHDLDLIETYAQKHNLVVSHRSEAERSLVLTGKLADLISAFPADLHLVHHSTGSFRARRGEIMIPEQLKGIITGIFGYDTRPKQKAPYATPGRGGRRSGRR